MNDQAAVIACVGKKRLSDPNQIMVALRIERLLRIDAGMDEKTLAIVVGERERAQPGNRFARQLARVVDVVASQRGDTAFLQPMFGFGLAIDDFERDSLMVS